MSGVLHHHNGTSFVPQSNTPVSHQYPVNTIAASGAERTLSPNYSAHDVTMDQNCVFKFAPPTTKGFTFTLTLKGMYTPTFPANVQWHNGISPTYGADSGWGTGNTYAFTTFDKGHSWIGSLAHEDEGYSPFTDITWHSAFWASDPDWVATGAVSSWRNAGTLGTAATQGTGSKQPTFRSSTAAFNNRSTVEFDATDDELTTGAFTGIARPYSLVVVGSISTTSGHRSMLYTNSTNAAPFTNVGRSGTFTNFVLYHNTPLTGPAPDTNPHLHVGRVDATGRYDVDASTSTGSITDTTQATNLFMNSNADGGNWAGGHRAFVGLYAGDIFADAAYPDFKKWVAAFYGITVS